MVGWFGRGTEGASADKLSRVDLAVMSLISLVFGLAIIAKGLIHGG